MLNTNEHIKREFAHEVWPPYAIQDTPDVSDIRMRSSVGLAGDLYWRSLGPMMKALYVVFEYANKFGGYLNLVRALKIKHRDFDRLGGFVRDYVLDRVCVKFLIDPTEFFEANRRGNMTSARIVYVALLSEYERSTDKEISSLFEKSRDFAKRCRCQFKLLFASETEALDSTGRAIVSTYLKIKTEIDKKIRG